MEDKDKIIQKIMDEMTKMVKSLPKSILIGLAAMSLKEYMERDIKEHKQKENKKLF